MKISSLSIAALGILGLSSTGVYLSGVFGSKGIPWRPLAEDSEFSLLHADNPYREKYGWNYVYYFMGVGKPKSGSIDNTHWWDFIYETRYKDQKPDSGSFANLTSGSGQDSSIRKACEQAYYGTAGSGSSSSTITFNGKQNTTNKTFKEEEIWKYCTYDGTKIKTISEVTITEGEDYSQGSYGKDTNKNKNLIATRGYNNDWFWNLKEREMFGYKQYPVSSSTNQQDNEFKKLWDYYRGSYSEGRFLVKAKCEEAYKETTSKENKYPSEDLIKFCSFKRIVGSNSGSTGAFPPSTMAHAFGSPRASRPAPNRS